MVEEEILYDPDYVTNCNDCTSYSRESILKARRYLIDECLSKECKTDVEMSLKRKCGILTQEVIRYYLSEKKTKPKGFINDLPDYLKKFQVNDNQFESEFFIDESDLVSSENGSPKNALAVQREEEEIEREENEEAEEEEEEEEGDVASGTRGKDDEQLCKELKLKHACENFPCPKYVKRFTLDYVPFDLRDIFVCDFCLHKEHDSSKMLEHLSNANHYSASLYLMSETSGQINYLKQRCSLKSLNDRNAGIFCPKCEFFFGQSVLACALHYSYIHDAKKSQYIYSVGEFKEAKTIKVNKEHVCSACNQKFKKLIDLIRHLDQSNHFPHSNQNEINVLVCPFHADSTLCSFKSTNYFSFKTHIVSHPYFNRQLKSGQQFEDVAVRVETYSKTDAFFHAKKFGSNKVKCLNEERQSELDAIESILNLYKGHTVTSELNKSIRSRKDYLLAKKFC